ncbi:AAA family ATPase, partial [Amycolatopsis sp. SID8362]|nr:AAA family ATPase [Amycolatopsis sp. SID8362]NED40614.1 AAA family ATPase [Amycolatopsis sp. SID8362]
MGKAGTGWERGNLPADTTSFVGRKADVAEVKQLLTRARLVTLTGVGGVGKTRLAVQTAAGLSRAFPNGVWLVELDGLQDPALVAHTVLEALGVHDETGRSPADVLAEHLRDRRTLVVLDNCEHLLDACAVLAHDLLRAAPGLRLLATSRERLALAGEHLWPVSPLPVPE